MWYLAKSALSILQRALTRDQVPERRRRVLLAFPNVRGRLPEEGAEVRRPRGEGRLAAFDVLLVFPNVRGRLPEEGAEVRQLPRGEARLAAVDVLLVFPNVRGRLPEEGAEVRRLPRGAKHTRPLRAFRGEGGAVAAAAGDGALAVACGRHVRRARPCLLHSQRRLGHRQRLEVQHRDLGPVAEFVERVARRVLLLLFPAQQTLPPAPLLRRRDERVGAAFRIRQRIHLLPALFTLRRRRLRPAPPVPPRSHCERGAEQEQSERQGQHKGERGVLGLGLRRALDAAHVIEALLHCQRENACRPGDGAVEPRGARRRALEQRLRQHGLHKHPVDAQADAALRWGDVTHGQHHGHRPARSVHPRRELASILALRRLDAQHAPFQKRQVQTPRLACHPERHQHAAFAGVRELQIGRRQLKGDPGPCRQAHPVLRASPHRPVRRPDRHACLWQRLHAAAIDLQSAWPLRLRCELRRAHPFAHRSIQRRALPAGGVAVAEFQTGRRKRARAAMLGFVFRCLRGRHGAGGEEEVFAAQRARDGAVRAGAVSRHHRERRVPRHAGQDAVLEDEPERSGQELPAGGRVSGAEQLHLVGGLPGSEDVCWNRLLHVVPRVGHLGCQRQRVDSDVEFCEVIPVFHCVRALDVPHAHPALPEAHVVRRARSDRARLPDEHLAVRLRHPMPQQPAGAGRPRQSVAEHEQPPRIDGPVQHHVLALLLGRVDHLQRLLCRRAVLVVFLLDADETAPLGVVPQPRHLRDAACVRLDGYTVSPPLPRRGERARHRLSRERRRRRPRPRRAGLHARGAFEASRPREAPPVPHHQFRRTRCGGDSISRVRTPRGGREVQDRHAPTLHREHSLAL